MNDLRLSPAFEIKRAAVDETGTFEGYASVYGGVDSYGDTIAVHAYKATLEKHQQANTRPAMLFSHDPAQPIGVWLDMREDGQGLRVKGKLTLAVDRAREAHALMMDGALGLSIGYQADDWGPGAKPGQRILKSVTLYEVSLVAMAADSGARILGIKSFETIRDFEDIARDALNLSAREAKRLAAGGYASLMGRDDRSEELAELARGIADRADELKSLLLRKGPR
jgi:HK97 family phage prohead protease